MMWEWMILNSLLEVGPGGPEISYEGQLNNAENSEMEASRMKVA